MKRNLANAVKGGLITGATVIGIDASINTAEATPLTKSAEVPFSLSVVDPDPNAMTCCPDLLADLLFEPFDSALGTLVDVELQFDSQQTLQQGGTSAISVLSTASLGGGILARTVSLGNFSFVEDLFSLGGTRLPEFFFSPFQLSLNSAVVAGTPDTLNWNGTATIVYSYNAAAVPEPGTIVLLLSAFGVTFAGRRCAWT